MHSGFRGRRRARLAPLLDLPLAHHVGAGSHDSDDKEHRSAGKTGLHQTIFLEHGHEDGGAQERGGYEQRQHSRGRQRRQPQGAAGGFLDIIDHVRKHFQKSR